MASRKKLKKTIQFASSELITDVYFRCLMSPKIDENKTDELVVRIMNTSHEFILRANRPAGKDNPKLVKDYFRSLYADWNKSMVAITDDINKL